MKHIFSFVTILSLLSLFLADCAVSPVSGVETGNPSKSAFARVALQLFDEKDAWIPSYWLVNGTGQLDTGVINNKPVYALAKTGADTDTMETLDSGSYVIVERTDTIINISTFFVVDTIVRSSFRADTITDTALDRNGPDGSTIIYQKLWIDSIFITDTITIADTVTVQRHDTIYTERFSPGSGIQLKTQSPGTVIVIKDTSKTAGSKGRDEEPVLPDQNGSGNIVSSILPVKISRSSTVAGMKIVENYTDGDGDGLLIARNGSGLSMLKLDVDYISDSYSLSLKVLFDPGADALLATTNDNRIYSLVRTKAVGGFMTEEVIYKTDSSSLISDTVVMNVARIFDSDTIAGTNTRYLCFPGGDRFDYRYNRLYGIAHTVRFRNSALKSIRINVILDTLINKLESPSTALIEAYTDYGKGNISVFSGTVDYMKMQVYGIYAENGTEYKFKYSLADDSYTIEYAD